MDEDFVSGSGGVASQLQALVVPALRKEREGRGTRCVGDANEIKRLGHPPYLGRGDLRNKDYVWVRSRAIRSRESETQDGDVWVSSFQSRRAGPATAAVKVRPRATSKTGEVKIRSAAANKGIRAASFA